MMKNHFRILTMSFVLCLTAPAIAAESVAPILYRPAPSSQILFNVMPEPVVEDPIQEAIDSWIEDNASRFELFQPDPGVRTFDGSVRVQDKLVQQSGFFWTEKKDKKEKKEKKDDVKPKLSIRTVADRATYDSIDEVALPVVRVEKDKAAAQISAVMKDLKFSAKCSRFASDEGFGPQGNQIISLLKSGKGDEMLDTIGDLKRVCPAWDKLGTSEKSYVWVKIFATMSMKESSCDPAASNHGAPDGKAKGLFQLNQGKEGAYADGCRKGDSLSAEASTKCAVSMINRQIGKDGALKSNSSYFGVLRPKGDFIYSRKSHQKKYVKLTDMLDLGLSKLPICHGK